MNCIDYSDVSGEPGVGRDPHLYKKGRLNFHLKPLRLDILSDMKAEACYACHWPPINRLNLCHQKEDPYLSGGQREKGLWD